MGEIGEGSRHCFLWVLSRQETCKAMEAHKIVQALINCHEGVSKFQTKCFDRARHSCGKVIVSDIIITVELVTKEMVQLLNTIMSSSFKWKLNGSVPVTEGKDPNRVGGVGKIVSIRRGQQNIGPS